MPGSYALSKFIHATQQFGHWIIAPLSTGEYVIKESPFDPNQRYPTLAELVATCPDLIGFLPIGQAKRELQTREGVYQ
jgi:hypothetical protein